MLGAVGSTLRLLPPPAAAAGCGGGFATALLAAELELGLTVAFCR